MTATVLDRTADFDVRASSAGATVTLRGATRTFGAHRVLRGIWMRRTGAARRGDPRSAVTEGRILDRLLRTTHGN